MKNKTKKHTLLLTLTLIVGCILTGCADFDATRYVQSCLDATFHGEFGDYMEMTKSTEDQARVAYDSLIQSEVDALEQGYTISDEQKEKFRALFTDMYKLCKYEVGEAVKNDDDSFSVPVTTYKLTVFAGMSDAIEQYSTEYMNDNPDTSLDDAYAALFDYMYDFINEKISNPEYAEGVTTNVNVPLTSTSPKTYTLSTSDLQNMVFDLLDVEESQ